MRKTSTLVMLALAHLFVVALAALVYFRARIAVLEAFRTYGTELPAATAFALSRLFLPITVGAGFAMGAVGLVAPLRPSRRLRIIATGLVVSSIGLVFSVWAAFAPIFRASL